MNNVELTPPAFPEQRQRNASTKLKLYVGGIVGALAFCFLGAEAGRWSVHFFQDILGWKIGNRFLLTASFIAMAVYGIIAAWWASKYWRRIDEMERRTTLNAFFWGGLGSWLVIMPLTVPPLLLPNFKLGLVESFTSTPSQGFAVGILVAIGATLLGNVAAGIFLWAKNR